MKKFKGAYKQCSDNIGLERIRLLGKSQQLIWEVTAADLICTYPFVQSYSIQTKMQIVYVLAIIRYIPKNKVYVSTNVTACIAIKRFVYKMKYFLKKVRADF